MHTLVDKAHNRFERMSGITTYSGVFRSCRIKDSRLCGDLIMRMHEHDIAACNNGQEPSQSVRVSTQNLSFDATRSAPATISAQLRARN